MYRYLCSHFMNCRKSDSVLACSRLRDSRVRTHTKKKREETGKSKGSGTTNASFSQGHFTHSYFCAPFTYASSPLSESLEQARNVKELCRQIVNSPF